MTNEENPTYDELATMIGYRMISIIGIMQNVGLTTLPYFVKTYFDPSQTENPVLRDFERWLKWSLAPTNAHERDHLFPAQFVQACQRLPKG
jgi:hypothetical protein